MLLKKTMPLEEYINLRGKIDFSNVDKINLIKAENNHLVEVSFKLPLNCSIDELNQDYSKSTTDLKQSSCLCCFIHTVDRNILFNLLMFNYFIPTTKDFSN